MDFFSRKFEKVAFLALALFAILLVNVFTNRPSFSNDQFEIRLRNDYGHEAKLYYEGTYFESGHVKLFLLNSDAKVDFDFPAKLTSIFFPGKNSSIELGIKSDNPDYKKEEVFEVEVFTKKYVILRLKGGRVYSLGESIEEARVIASYVRVKN